MGFLSSVLDFLFPPKCMFCRKVLPVGQRGCCSICEQKLIVDLPPGAGYILPRAMHRCVMTGRCAML